MENAVTRQAIAVCDYVVQLRHSPKDVIGASWYQGMVAYTQLELVVARTRDGRGDQAYLSKVA